MLLHLLLWGSLGDLFGAERSVSYLQYATIDALGANRNDMVRRIRERTTKQQMAAWYFQSTGSLLWEMVGIFLNGEQD